MENDASEVIKEFLSVVDNIYGVYLDSTRGFVLVRKDIDRGQVDAIQRLRKTHPDKANIPYLDTASFIYGKGNPSDPDAIALHVVTQGGLKVRNNKDGANYKFIARMCVVSLYQYWEDAFRGRIAKAKNIEKNQIVFPAMGDLRLMRQSIIHHASIALPDISKCEILKWFKAGDEINLTDGHMEDIIYHIKVGLKNLQTS